MEDVLEAVYDNLIRNGITEVTVYTAGDNIPMLRALEQDSTDLSIRNIIAKTKILGSQIVKKFKGAVFFLCYIPGPKNTADFSSKKVDNPLSAVNSALWREGPPEFMNSSSLRKNAYGHICDDTY